MANYTIFGTSAPAGMTTDTGTTSGLNLFTAFYMTSGSGYQITGARVWIPSDGVGGAGYKGYLWQGQNAATATRVAAVDFPSVATGAWNSATFSAPVDIVNGTYYWISVYFPGGKYAYRANEFSTALPSTELPGLYGAATGEVSPGNGAYNLAATAGLAASGSSGSGPWYGVDVVVSPAGGPGAVSGSDTATFSDAVSAVRGGLASQITVQGSAADPLGGSASDTRDVATGGTTSHSFEVSMLGNRIWMGSPIERVTGPALVDGTPPAELGVEFQVKREVWMKGARVYKHPQAAGSMSVTLWSEAGASLASTTGTWSADGGGWRRYSFPSRVKLSPGVKYRISYFNPGGGWASNRYYFNAQEMYEPPFWVNSPDQGPAAGVFNEGSHAFPNSRGEANYYWVDPIADIDNDLPAPTAGVMSQWTNYTPHSAFPVGVYYPDPPFVTEYYDMGVNTMINVPVGVAGYREAILSRPGLDIWSTADPDWIVSDAELAPHVMGYVLGDEPDMAGGLYRTPQEMRETMAWVRGIDSSRPVLLNFGTAAGLTATWSFIVAGKTLTEHMDQVIQQIQIPDIVSLDLYSATPKAAGVFGGVWTYFAQVRRMRQFSDGLKPVWAIVESTSQEPGFPTPAAVRQTTWASLIAGAKGIVYFDHRFGDAQNTQDFAAMLHDAPMKAEITALSAQMQALAPALMADEANLVTSVASSNTTAGPLGGTHGVPIEYTTRQAGGKSYLFAMSARPGSTTATFTVPAAAGKTLTRIGEAGTVTVSAGGTFIQSFSSDYEIHLYEWVS